MNNKIVIGIGFGDEGKGRVVDYFCNTVNPSLVVRFSGGHQAAHQVITENGVRHTFSNFGSGSLRGIPTYISKYCTVDPIGILNEFNVLKEKGINPILYIDPKCPVTTPLEKYANIKEENKNLHGTCGVGFGKTWEREENLYSLSFEDLFNPTILSIKLDMLENYYGIKKEWVTYKGQKYKIPTNSIPAPLGYDKNAFMDDCQSLIYNKNIILTNESDINLDQSIVFEGSQGLLLDQNIGFFPHVTRSNVCMKNISKMTDFFPQELYLVTRAYQTRHGNGPMTNEDYTQFKFENPYEFNEFNSFQGCFRTSLLDLDLLKYSVNKDEKIRNYQNKTLVITCLDVIKDQYVLTEHGQVYDLKTKENFIQRIKESLDIENVLTSESPYGNMERKG